MSGFTYSYRDKWTHPIFRNLQEAGVWAWLCDKAFWRDGQMRFNNVLVNLKRGEYATSIRYISENFNLSERATRTLLENLEKEKMIAARTTNKLTIIKLCNYDKYQSSEKPDDTQGDEQPPDKRQADDTPIKREVIKEDKESKTPCVKDLNLEFDKEFWPSYPRKEDKLKAIPIYRKVRKSGISKEELVAGARRYAHEKALTEIKYLKLPTTWLNAGSWANGTETQTQAPSQPITFDAEWKEDAMRIGNLDATACRTFLAPLRLMTKGNMATIFAGSRVTRDYAENRMGEAIRLAVQGKYPEIQDIDFSFQRNEPPTQEGV